MKLTALIPVYNDDYALGFCLASIIEHFDEIVVLDDASTDETPEVALGFARAHGHVRYVRHEGRQLGWIEARNRLARFTEGEHLFWLDSDDVLCEYNVGLLRQIAEGPAPIVRLYLTEMWGDFYHTTQRLRHYDRCHMYMNRAALRDFAWTGSPAGRGEGGTAARCDVHREVVAQNGPGPLFFHIKGVKPDRRLVQRRLMRRWLGDPAREDNLEARIAEMGEEEVHRLALEVLLRSKQDHLVPTYLENAGVAQQLHKVGASRPPTRAEVIEAALPGRFEIRYPTGGSPDRFDRRCPISSF